MAIMVIVASIENLELRQAYFCFARASTEEHSRRPRIISPQGVQDIFE